MDKPVEVTDGVYAYPQHDGSWWVNTTGFVVGRRDIVAIDSCSTRRRTERFRAAIAGVADLPVTRLVNTYHHGDHTYGNALFDATVIGHENCRTEALNNRAREQVGTLWAPLLLGDLVPTRGTQWNALGVTAALPWRIHAQAQTQSPRTGRRHRAGRSDRSPGIVIRISRIGAEPPQFRTPVRTAR